MAKVPRIFLEKHLKMQKFCKNFILLFISLCSMFILDNLGWVQGISRAPSTSTLNSRGLEKKQHLQEIKLDASRIHARLCDNCTEEVEVKIKRFQEWKKRHIYGKIQVSFEYYISSSTTGASASGVSSNPGGIATSPSNCTILILARDMVYRNKDLEEKINTYVARVSSYTGCQAIFKEIEIKPEGEGGTCTGEHCVIQGQPDLGVMQKLTAPPSQLKKIIKDVYQESQGSLKGAVLVGDLPVAWLEGMVYNDKYDIYPSDYYYMDLGEWTDEKTEGTWRKGAFDTPKGDFKPEIFVSRIDTHLIRWDESLYGAIPKESTPEIEYLKEFFDKLILYYEGGITTGGKAGLFIIPGWVNPYTSSAVRVAYPVVEMLTHPKELTKENFLRYITKEDYEYVVATGHASPNIQWLFPGNLTPKDLKENPPQATILNITGGCHPAEFVSDDFIAGSYIFSKSYEKDGRKIPGSRGLVIIGESSRGRNSMDRVFYESLSSGDCVGEAVRKQLLYDIIDYGTLIAGASVVILGDPFVKKGSVATSAYPNIELGVETAKEFYLPGEKVLLNINVLPPVAGVRLQASLVPGNNCVNCFYTDYAVTESKEVTEPGKPTLLELIIPDSFRRYEEANVVVTARKDNILLGLLSRRLNIFQPVFIGVESPVMIEPEFNGPCVDIDIGRYSPGDNISFVLKTFDKDLKAMAFERAIVEVFADPPCACCGFSPQRREILYPKEPGSNRFEYTLKVQAVTGTRTGNGTSQLVRFTFLGPDGRKGYIGFSYTTAQRYKIEIISPVKKEAKVYDVYDKESIYIGEYQPGDIIPIEMKLFEEDSDKPASFQKAYISLSKVGMKSLSELASQNIVARPPGSTLKCSFKIPENITPEERCLLTVQTIGENMGSRLSFDLKIKSPSKYSVKIISPSEFSFPEGREIDGQYIYIGRYRPSQDIPIKFELFDEDRKPSSFKFINVEIWELGYLRTFYPSSDNPNLFEFNYTIPGVSNNESYRIKFSVIGENRSTTFYLGFDVLSKPTYLVAINSPEKWGTQLYLEHTYVMVRGYKPGDEVKVELELFDENGNKVSFEKAVVKTFYPSSSGSSSEEGSLISQFEVFPTSLGTNILEFTHTIPKEFVSPSKYYMKIKIIGSDGRQGWCGIVFEIERG